MAPVTGCNAVDADTTPVDAAPCAVVVPAERPDAAGPSVAAVLAPAVVDGAEDAENEDEDDADPPPAAPDTAPLDGFIGIDTSNDAPTSRTTAAPAIAHTFHLRRDHATIPLRHALHFVCIIRVPFVNGSFLIQTHEQRDLVALDNGFTYSGLPYASTMRKQRLHVDANVPQRLSGSKITPLQRAISPVEMDNTHTALYSTWDKFRRRR